ncbi:unnamed protein product, partial [Mesorhabditis belari]|uniref:Acyltransferase n=1 Tax=Mesorhabditis belari TaxID=2138241 RepID=A0AAF3E9Y6_9BILA
MASYYRMPDLAGFRDLLATKWKHAMEKLSVAHFVFVWLLMPLMSLWVPIYILFQTQLWPTVPVYMAWMVYDWKTPRRGGRTMSWYQRLGMWNHFRDYFPIKLVKTVDLSPDRNYIMGSHPHGVLCVGAFSNFLTASSKFTEFYPGLDPTILTLDGQFKFPLRREIALATGGVSSSRDSLEWLLKNPGKGRAVAVVVGGAEEALDARPGSTRLKLLGRYGFVRYAIQYHCCLVPVFNFGENDLYSQQENQQGSRLRSIQGKIKSWCGFAPPLLHGCGLLAPMGLLPFRSPVTTLIGKPICCKIDGHEYGTLPSEELVIKQHSLYMQGLVDLFEANKTLHGNFKDDDHLEFV